MAKSDTSFYPRCRAGDRELAGSRHYSLQLCFGGVEFGTEIGDDLVVDVGGEVVEFAR